jgi:GNAT superfamily N-acetyltransferase
LVACDTVDPNVIYGYLVKGTYLEGSLGEVPVVHYLYVKAAFRKMGIARTLVEASKVPLDKFSFSHWTFAMDGLIERLPGAVYIPYLI